MSFYLHDVIMQKYWFLNVFLARHRGFEGAVNAVRMTLYDTMEQRTLAPDIPAGGLGGIMHQMALEMVGVSSSPPPPPPSSPQTTLPPNPPPPKYVAAFYRFSFLFFLDSMFILIQNTTRQAPWHPTECWFCRCVSSTTAKPPR